MTEITSKADSARATLALAGDELQPQYRGPITRTMLALFAGASGDHNPIHIDLDFARAAGLSDVFAHGMLSAAFAGNWLADLVGPTKLRTWNVRFVSITPVGAELELSGRIIERFEEEGEPRARIKFQVATRAGQTTIVGEAIISAPAAVG